MTPQQLFSTLNDQLSQVLPDVAKTAQDDINQHIKSVLAGMLSKLDLVTREEFEIQKEVLLETRKRLGQLEKRVIELESIAGSEK